MNANPAKSPAADRTLEIAFVDKGNRLATPEWTPPKQAPRPRWEFKEKQVVWVIKSRRSVSIKRDADDFVATAAGKSARFTSIIAAAIWAEAT